MPRNNQLALPSPRSPVPQNMAGFNSYTGQLAVSVQDTNPNTQWPADGELAAILDDLKNRMNSSLSSYHPDAIHPFLRIIFVQFILFFISSWCNSSFSSYHPGAIHPFLHIIHIINFFLNKIVSFLATSVTVRC